MRITFTGTGDAYGAGGRLHTCFHIARAGHAPVLLDCGATALIGLERAGLEVAAIDTVFVTHLHGDHFAGLVWLLLEARFVSKRERRLTVFGPPGLEARLRAAMDSLYQGALDGDLGFPLKFRVMVPGEPVVHESLLVEPVAVDHPTGESPSLGLKLSTPTRAIAFSGDSAWTDAMVPLCRGADLAILDCWAPDGAPAVHMSYAQITAHAEGLGAKRIVLTHMGKAMLAHAARLTPLAPGGPIIPAHDGLVIEL